RGQKNVLEMGSQYPKDARQIFIPAASKNEIAPGGGKRRSQCLHQGAGRRDVVGTVKNHERMPAHDFQPRGPMHRGKTSSNGSLWNVQSSRAKALHDGNGDRRVGGLMFTEEAQFVHWRDISIVSREPSTRY